MRPRKEDSVDAKREILAAAEKCFGHRGFAGTSVQDIVKETRFTKPVLYYYFGSKEGLFLALMEEALRESNEAIIRASTAPGTVRDRLIGVYLGLFDILKKRRELVRLAFSNAFASAEEIPVSDEIITLRQQNLDLIHDMVKEGRRSGELGETFDSLSMAHGIFGAICFSLMHSLTTGSIPLTRKTATTMVDLYFQGAAAGQ